MCRTFYVFVCLMFLSQVVLCLCFFTGDFHSTMLYLVVKLRLLFQLHNVIHVSCEQQITYLYAK